MNIVEPTENEASELERRALEQAQSKRPTPAPYRWAEPFTTVGVTGTNGKTSTTKLVAAALAGPKRPVLEETTVGYSFDGKPVNVKRTLRGFLGALARAAQLGGRHAAIETTSQALSRGYARIWRFDVGVFTNLSHDHLGHHGSFEHYLASKAQLFVMLGPGRTAILNAADKSALLIDRVTPNDVNRIWYGVPSRGQLLRQAELQARRVTVTLDGTEVELEDSDVARRLGGLLRTRFVGEVFAENLLAAAGAALAVGIEPEELASNLEKCDPVPGRFEVIHRKPTVVLDYAHSSDALARVCKTARHLAGQSRVIVVFGASGGSDESKREPMGRAVGKHAEYAFVTSDNPRHEAPDQIAKAVARGCRRGGRAHTTTLLDRGDAIRKAVGMAEPGDVVLIAGKGHENYQEIGSERVPFSDASVAKEILDA